VNSEHADGAVLRVNLHLGAVGDTGGAAWAPITAGGRNSRDTMHGLGVVSGVVADAISAAPDVSCERAVITILFRWTEKNLVEGVTRGFAWFVSQ
jgi:hypothetical protein